MIPISACTADYLMQAKRDQAEAAILYNYTTSSDMPTSALTNTFSAFNNPLYGIAGGDAGPILENMVNYAGNMSSVPLGKNLTAIYDPTDYVRLTLTIDTGQTSSLPGLWLFLLVILAALGLIIASTSVSMHVSQYRARRDLRRRLANGEIDLESLGIKRLTVPKEMIDSMPIKIFGASSMAPAVAAPMAAEQKLPPTHSSSPSTATVTSGEHASSPDNLPNDNLGYVQNPPTVGFEQSPCCAICLDDYVVNTTPVRHLPCNHIFHPHCIDPFLMTRSSLCPLCKRSVLPKGFIPPTLQLTNATVARERRIRLMRERASNNQTPAGLESGDIEMTSPGTHPTGDPGAPTQEEEDEELRRRPIARRVLESVFPRFTRPVGTVVRSIRRTSTVRS
jgi:hypothetical protein